MKEYSVKELAQIAGISIRTLHHYDQIGLLKPRRRSEKNYRFYGQEELLLLQQIMFYREFEMDLKTIKSILQSPSFKLVEALEFHKIELKKKKNRIAVLLKTIDKTIKSLKSEKAMLSEKELYQGFHTNEVEVIRTEVKDRWGEKKLLETEKRLKALDSNEWKEQKAKEEETNQLLASLMDLDPTHQLVQQAVEQHFQNLNLYYEVKKERYRELAEMYTQDDRFRAFYDKYRIGLADYLKEAIHFYCDNKDWSA